MASTVCYSIFGVISCSNSADTIAKPMVHDAKAETVTLTLTGLK